MKLKDVQLDRPNEEILVLPRNGQDIVIKARAILDFSDFDTLCPVPKPPRIQHRGGRWVDNPTDEKFIKAHEDWAKARLWWMIIQSLKATEGLEWETIQANDSETWTNVEQELTDANFTEAERNLIVDLVLRANNLKSDHLEEAKTRFFDQQLRE